MRTHSPFALTYVKLKYFLLLIPGLFITSAGNSQSVFGLMAGPQASTVLYKANNVKQSTEHKYGFQLGATMKVAFEEQLFFVPQAYYSLKGYKVEFTQFLYPPSVDAKDNNTSIHTFETAFLLQFDFSKDPGHLFLRSGPALDFQLFGKEKYNVMPSGSVSTRMKYGYGEYGHFAANIQFHFGYESAGGFMIYGQYGRGITSLNNADDGPRMRHRTFGLVVGKLFR